MLINQIQFPRKGANQSEDIVISRQLSDNTTFYGVADGQSNQCYCRDGAKASLDAVANYFSLQPLHTLQQRFTDEIQFELLRTIRECLATLALKYAVGVDCFASTLCCVVVDTGHHLFMTLHLGDGEILGITSNHRLQVISGGERGITRNHTWLTTTDGALTHLQLSWGSTTVYQCLYLITDGFRYKEKELIGQDVSQISSYAERQHRTDDATLVMIKFKNT